MNTIQNMKNLADDELLSRAKNLAKQERAVTAKLLNHLMEIERRLLFAKLGYSSLFKYAWAAVREFGLRKNGSLSTTQSSSVTGNFKSHRLLVVQRLDALARGWAFCERRYI